MAYPWNKDDLRYSREDYKNLYDLVNNAFANFKERMSDKPTNKFKTFFKKIGFGK